MRYLIFLLILLSCSQPKPDSFTLSSSIYGESISVLVVNRSDIQSGDSMDFSQVNGLTLSEGGEILIWLPDYNQPPNIVSHEIFHAAYAVMEWVGIPLSPSSEEAYAYLIDHISKEFYEYYR